MSYFEQRQIHMSTAGPMTDRQTDRQLLGQEAKYIFKYV